MRRSGNPGSSHDTKPALHVSLTKYSGHSLSYPHIRVTFDRLICRDFVNGWLVAFAKRVFRESEEREPQNYGKAQFILIKSSNSIERSAILTERRSCSLSGLCAHTGQYQVSGGQGLRTIIRSNKRVAFIPRT
jgi:hypothetical protein